MNKKFVTASAGIAVVTFILTGCAGATSLTPSPNLEPPKTSAPKPSGTPIAPSTLPEAKPEPEPYISRIVLNADTLVTVDNEGTVVDEVSFDSGTPQDIVNAIIPALGGPNITYQGEENPCTYNLSTYKWDGLFLVFSGKDASIQDDYYYVVAGEGGADKKVSIESSQGAKFGDSFSKYIYAHPQIAVEPDVEYEGTTYSRSLDQHTSRFLYEADAFSAEGVTITAINDKITTIFTPSSFYGDC